MVAIVVVMHISLDISLIVAYIHRLRILVIGRIITVVVRGSPRRIARAIQMSPNTRSLYPYRTYDICGTIDIRITDNLNIQIRCAGFCYERSNVLVDICGQTCLDQIHMTISLHRLQHTQIIYPTVTIQVQVVDHITRGVKVFLKLAYGRRLRKGSSHSLQIEIVGQVRGKGIDLNRRRNGRMTGRSRYRADGSYRLRRTNRYGLGWSRSNDTHRETGC